MNEGATGVFQCIDDVLIYTHDHRTLRYLGMVTIILNDYPMLKYVLVGIMGLFVLTNKEVRWARFFLSILLTRRRFHLFIFHNSLTPPT